MGKRSFVVSLDYNAGVLFRKFRDEGGLTNSDIFKEFFSHSLIAPIVKPVTKYLRANINKIIIGTVLINPTAHRA